MSLEIFEKAPSDFKPQVQVASVYLTVESEILFLQRSGSERGYWGVPAGKVESGELLDVAAKRELLEETGIQCDAVAPVGSLYIRKPGIDYIYHLYSVLMKVRPVVTLSDEHLDYGWYSSKEVQSMQLMAGALEAFEYFLSHRKTYFIDLGINFT